MSIPWHVPKRSSLLQAVGAIHIIKALDLDRKKWSPANSKKFNQGLATWGLTSKGTSLSSTARETLEAFLKYLGLIIINTEKILYITPAGFELINEFGNFHKPEKNLRLKDSEKIYNYRNSKTIARQLKKLVIANPTIENRHLEQGTKIQPLIEVLYYCLKLDNLSREEIALFIFFQKTVEERDLVIDKIKQFRKLDKDKQNEQIVKFSSTYVGNKVYGESSATVKYFESLLKISGYFEEKGAGLRIKSHLREEISLLLDETEEIPDFMLEDEEIWLSFFVDTEKIRFPRKLTINFEKLRDYKILLDIQTNNKPFLKISKPGLKVEGETHVNTIVYPETTNKLFLKILQKSGVKEILLERTYPFSKNNFSMTVEENISVSGDAPVRIDYITELSEMVKKNELSDNYLSSISDLLVLSGIVENKNQAKDYIKKRKNLIKGGRFEKLFFELLKNKEEAGIIDSVVEWRGNLINGIYNPSPAGKGYQTDIEFIVDNYYFGLELTTASGRAQWKTEAESVTDHIGNLKEDLKNKEKVYKVVGIFTSPMITDFMKAICLYFSNQIYKVPIITIESLSLLDILKESKSKDELIKKIKELSSLEIWK